jgi:hypothetical protein
MTTSKPSFLGLLNAIAIGETEAEPLLLAWAGTCQDQELAKTLRFVGMREGEHGKAFAKRMLELGYEVRWPDRTGPEPQRLEIAGSTEHSDVAKFEALGIGMGFGEADVFDTMFTDKTIDPVTGGLLGRYIAEERDSLRMLAADYERLKRVLGSGPDQPAHSANGAKATGKKAGAKKASAKKASAKKAGPKKIGAEKAGARKKATAKK